MKLLKAEVHNFSSYKHLNFDFSGKGLCLVYGSTGSGKSTLQDIPTWVLYGATAKGGAVDEVRSWQASGETTKGTIELETPSGPLTVTRIRGRSTENDLFWEENGQKYRGKDVSDTQKLLAGRLGASKDLFTIAAQFHEFSPTANFFLSNAKGRRDILEKLTNLDLAVKLAERTTSAKKEAKNKLQFLNTDISRRLGKLEQLRESLAKVKKAFIEFEKEREIIVSELQKKSETFEADKTKKIEFLTKQKNELWDKWSVRGSFEGEIEYLQKVLNKSSSSVCITCSAPLEFAAKEEYRDKIAALQKEQYVSKQMEEKIKVIQREIDDLCFQENQYSERIEEKKTSKNPYLSQISNYTQDLEISEKGLKSTQDEHAYQSSHYSSLEYLYDLSLELRGVMLQQAVDQVQTSTNNYLSTYFDSEFQIEFSLEDSDKLEVSITKNGYECTFTQLSKGQRQLLKLCFAVSVMKAASNNAGVHFDSLFLDEALDGLDTELKVKAFSLLQELEKSHGTVLVIDHTPEFHNLFDKRYHVTLEGDNSHIEEENG